MHSLFCRLLEFVKDLSVPGIYETASLLYFSSSYKIKFTDMWTDQFFLISKSDPYSLSLYVLTEY
jgi:hypothetical protein